MGDGEVTNEGETDTAPRNGRVRVPVESMEWLPDALSLCHGDARALVLDPNARPPIIAASVESDRYRLARRTVLHGIVEQVDQDLTDRAPIDIGNDIIIQAHPDLHVPRCRERRECFKDLPHQWGELRLFGHERVLTTFHAIEAQYLVDQVSETSRFLIDDVE
jgi:hypothetical protein